MDCLQFYGLHPFHGLCTISWTAYNFTTCFNFMDCLPCHGLPTTLWTANNFMDCLQFHGLPTIFPTSGQLYLLPYPQLKKVHCLYGPAKYSWTGLGQKLNSFLRPSFRRVVVREKGIGQLF